VRRPVFVVAAVLILASVSLVGQSTPSIRGVWKVAEVTFTGPNAEKITNPQPGVYIFTAKHYSMVRDTARTPRPVIKDLTKITEAGAFATFNPFQGQSGTYEITGSTLKTTALVAKVPPTSGKYGAAFATYTFKIEGDTLSLTQVTGLGGRSAANPTTIRLTRIE
jgi:hypothetical protein